MGKISLWQYLTPVLILLSTLVVWSSTAAQTGDPLNPKPLLLTDEQGEYPLGLHLEILEDPGGELTIDDVSSQKFDSQFIPSQVAVPNYGFTDSAYWVRVRLDNQTRQIDEWLLEVGFANMHYVDLYTPLPEGEGFTVKQSGSLRPVSTRDVLNSHIVFELFVPSQSQQTIYLRFQNGASMTLPLTLWTPAAFLDRLQVEQTLMGLFYGVLISLLCYHLFLLFSLREASYICFVILLASIILQQAFYDGYLVTYIFPNLDFIKVYYHPLSFSLMIASMVLFSDVFLELKRRLPKLHRVILVILAIWGVLMLLTPFTSYHFIASLMVPWAILSLLVVLIGGFLSWLGGFRITRFFLLAWFGMIAGLIVIILVRLGLIPSSLFTENVYRLGFLWVAVCWSVALADRINLLKSETENANRALRSNEHRLSQILEGLPIGVVVYGKDRKPNYGNRRTVEILSNPAQGIQPDISGGRTLEDAIDYYSLHKAGSGQPYPAENFPVNSALNGKPASADDIQANLGDKQVSLEIWASPVRDDNGNIESAVVAFQDITHRRQAEAELVEYRKDLEALVERRTTELVAVNEWLNAINQAQQTVSGTENLAEADESLSRTILHIFDAGMVCILRWGDQGEQAITICHPHLDNLSPDLGESFKSALQINPPLRKEIDQGKIVQLSTDQMASLPLQIQGCFQKDGLQSLTLAPMVIRQITAGVLGVAWRMPPQEIDLQQITLVEKMALDLADLAQDAFLLDQALALATAEERNRLARELHDSVTQTLFTSSVLAEATPRIWEKDPNIARQNMEKLSVLIRGALAEMRSLLLELRSGELHNQTLSQLLATLSEAGRVRTRAVISISITGDRPLPDKVTIAFYRIAQEALNNAMNHAQAEQIKIDLLEKPDLIELRVRDDGIGFDPFAIPERHLGLSIMAERAAQVGADLRVQSEPGHGTEIILTWSSEVDNG